MEFPLQKMASGVRLETGPTGSGGEKEEEEEEREGTAAGKSHLPGHNLSVDAADVDPSVKAGLVVGIDDVSPERFVHARPAVVRALPQFPRRVSERSIAGGRS